MFWINISMNLKDKSAEFILIWFNGSFSVDLPCGNGEMSIKESSNSWTPKLFKAEPKIQVLFFLQGIFLYQIHHTHRLLTPLPLLKYQLFSPIKSESAWS